MRLWRLGTTTLANGSDIAGSIRIPASASQAWWASSPPTGACPSRSPFNMDPLLPFGAAGADVLKTAGFSKTSSPGPMPSDIASLRPKLRIPEGLGDIKGWRVAVSMDLGYFEVDPEVVAKTPRPPSKCFRGLGAVKWSRWNLGWSLADT